MATSAPPAEVTADRTSVFPRDLDWPYPNIDRGAGVRLYGVDGSEILDACGAGAMVACLGHGRRDLVEAAARQAERLSYVYYHHFTNELQEELGRRVIDVAAPEMARVRFVTGGSEANEMALRLARGYHAERGESRWRIVSPAQSYHGATLGTLALSGRRSLQHPYEPYLADHLHIAPSTGRFDETGSEALAELDRLLEALGPETIAAFVCEPVSAAALPAYSPPQRFWDGLAERRERHGFLIVFDEIVTGFGRTGSWFAYNQLPLGAPLLCAVGLAVLEALVDEGLVERVRARGPALRDELEAAVGGHDIVGEVRGCGYLLGVELVDPRDGESFLPNDVKAAALVDATALEHGLLVTSSHSAPDGFTGDQTLIAPAYVATDEELAEMVERFAASISEVESRVKNALAASSGT